MIKFYEIMNNQYSIIGAHDTNEVIDLYHEEINSEAVLDKSDLNELVLDDLYDILTGMIVINPSTGFSKGLISFNEAMKQVNKIISDGVPKILLVDQD